MLHEQNKRCCCYCYKTVVAINRHFIKIIFLLYALLRTVYLFFTQQTHYRCHAPDCQEVTYCGEVCATTECILCKMFYYK